MQLWFLLRFLHRHISFIRGRAILRLQVRNLVQNVTGIDEKIEKAAPKKPSATSKLKGLSRLTTPSKVSRTSSMNSEAMLAASPPSPGEMGKNMSPEELLELTHEVE